LEIQYADYAVWQRQWIEGENSANSRLPTGKTTLAGAPAVASSCRRIIPRPIPAGFFAGGYVELVLDEQTNGGF